MSEENAPPAAYAFEASQWQYEALQSQASVYASRLFVMSDPHVFRIMFCDQMQAAAPLSLRASVALSVGRARELHEMLGSALQELDAGPAE